MTYTINVCEFLGTVNLLAPNKGQELKNKITLLLCSKQTVTLDFSGYKYLASSFLNEAIGRLIIENQWNSAAFKEKVKWINISEDDEVDIELSIENAKTKLYLIKNKIDERQFYQANLHSF